MENLLHGIAGVCVYLVDILLTGNSECEHLFSVVLGSVSKRSVLLDRGSESGHVLTNFDNHVLACDSTVIAQHAGWK